MQIRVTLMGALKAQSPPGGTLELPENATVADALGALTIDPAAIQTVMRNGRPERNHTVPLSAGDELTILPPVGGG